MGDRYILQNVLYEFNRSILICMLRLTWTRYIFLDKASTYMLNKKVTVPCCRDDQRVPWAHPDLVFSRAYNLLEAYVCTNNYSFIAELLKLHFLRNLNYICNPNNLRQHMQNCKVPKECINRRISAIYIYRIQ